MSEHPFFSVIIPAHNAEGYIRRGLDSIRDQDFKDYEVIVVCDACTDNTVGIVKEYADHWITTEFGRAGAARNVGLDLAMGKWILFMDDDDWFLPHAFRTIAEAVKAIREIDVLAFSFEWKGRGAARQSRSRIYPAVWNKAWRRSFIGNERFPDWIHTDDLGFARKMHPIARFAFIDAVLYHYEFMRPGSISDRIRNGEFDNNMIPESCRDAAIGYERWLKSKEF